LVAGMLLVFGMNALKLSKNGEVIDLLGIMCQCLRCIFTHELKKASIS
jgi:hypothetical protein